MSEHLLASAAFDGTVLLWDVRKSKPLDKLYVSKTGVNGVAFSNDGLLATANSDGTVLLFNLDKEHPAAPAKQPTLVGASRSAVKGVRSPPPATTGRWCSATGTSTPGKS